MQPTAAATPKSRSLFPAQSPARSLGAAINSASHVATSPLLVSPQGPQHSLSSRNLFSLPPSPSPPNSGTSLSGSVITTQYPPAMPRPVAAVKGGPNTHERMWAEMQQKLEEVDISADHVFGAEHARSLESLRTAQVQLAQAWIRSEEDELDNKHSEFGKKAFAGAPPRTERAGGGLFDMERVEGEGEEEKEGEGEGEEEEGGEGEEEEENDVLLARKRRLANDEHFNRIAVSVIDVTRKLEDVARAMAGVELESRSIWAGSSESDGSSMR